MDMTIYYSTIGIDSLFECDSAEWNGNIYTSTGIYIDTLSTINGCDSIVTMDMTIYYSTIGIDSLFECDSAEWNGNIYTTTGIYIDTLSTTNGCDSIVTMDMTIYYSATGTDSLFACDSAEWNGNIFYTSGIVVDTLQTLSGCDSVVLMDIKINYSTTNSDFLTSCDSAEWNGNIYTSTGLYIDTLQTSSGCDSIVTLNLIINNSELNNYNLVACDSAEWNGNIYTSSGIYVDSLQTMSGCDSIVTMDMTINYSATGIDSLFACDSAEWNGNIYTSSGIYIDTLSTINGCDSIVSMNLTINSSNISFDTLTGYDILTWNGNLYDSSGSYIDTLQNSNGCDSIVTLDLTIFYTVFSADSLFECDSAEWNGNIYINSGTFIDTLATINGADSIVTMDITIYNSTFSSEISSACDSIVWNGNIYNSSGVYLDTLQSINGCDSVVSLYLTINSSKTSNESQVACNEYAWNGITFNSTGIYVDTLQTSAGCDSIATLDLTINFSSPLSAGSNTTICYGESITLNALGTGSVTWNNGVTDGQSFTADSTSTYIAQLTNNFGCISIDTTLITVLSLPNIDAGLNQDICLEDSIQLIGFGADSLNWFHPVLNIYDSIYLSLNQTSTFYLNGVDSNGCSNNDSIIITVNSLPNISIDSISPVCYGDAITLKAQGGVIYNWTGGFNNNSNIIPDSSQWYIVSVINGNQCQKTDSVFAQVYDAPIINAGNDTSICLFDSITLSATGNALSYNWTNNVIDGIPFVPSVSNKYVVSGTNLNSCVNYDTIQIDLIILSVDAGGNQVLCTGDSAILNGIGLNPIWSSGVLDGVPFYPNISSEYILTVSDSNGCVRNDTTIIGLFDLPNVKAPEDTTLCLGEEIQLFGSGAQTYLWDNGYFDGELLSPDYSSFYILTGIDSNGCRNFDTTYIEVTENPVISYTTKSVIYGNDATIMVYISGGTPWEDCGGLEPCQEPYLYDWDIDGLGDVDDQLHQFYLNSGSYFLTIYDSLSCSDTSTITVEGNFQIFVPDAVTPNADGINDTWDILGINNYPNASIKVFNIQGQIIFEHNNSNNGDFQPWPATFSDGQALPASDYYYHIILDPNNLNVSPLTGALIITY
jgi:gliding motility-associated-like protein